MSSSISSFSGSESIICECSSCKYQLLEPYPFYPTLCRPMVYLAQVRQGKEQKQEKKRNLFLRAFQWYTEEHRPHNSTATTSTVEVTKEPLNKDDDASAFANWLDLKYQQYLQQKPENSNICCERRVITPNAVVCEQMSIQQNDMSNPSSTKRKFSKFTKCRMQSKSADRACRRDCQTNAPGGSPTSSPSMNTGAKIKIEDEIKPVKIEKPPMEQKADVVKPLVKQKSYVIEPASELKAKEENQAALKETSKAGHSEVANEVKAKEENLKTILKEPSTVAHSSVSETANEVKANEENFKSTLKEPSTVAHSLVNEAANEVKTNEEMLKTASKEPIKAAHSNKKRKHNNITCQCEVMNKNAKTQYKPPQSQPYKRPSSTQQKEDEESPKTNEEQYEIKSDISTQYETESKEVHIQCQEQPIPICCPLPTSQSAEVNVAKVSKPNAVDELSLKQESQPPISQKICPSFQKPCPSFAKLASEQAIPCPSLLQPCPGKRRCPTLHGPCFLPPPKINKTVLERQPSVNVKDVQESPSKSEPPVNPEMCPSIQKPNPSHSKPASELATPCPSLQQACPAQRRCPTFRGPCPNSTKFNETVLQQQPQLKLTWGSQESTKPYQPINPKICPTFHEPCPSFYKPVSEIVAPCPSFQQPYTPDHGQCPNRHVPCFYNTAKINTAVLQLQPQIIQRDTLESSSKSEEPVNQKQCPTYHGACPSLYKSTAGLVTPCQNLPQSDRRQCPSQHGPIDPRYLHYENSCICQRTIPPRQLIRREICLQRFCDQCANICAACANAFNINENQPCPSAPVPQYTVVGQCSVEHDIQMTTKTECVSVISEGVSTKPSSANLACQTSDHSIRLDKETIGSDYPFFMKIVCADRLKQ